MTSSYMQLLTAYTAQDQNVTIAFFAALAILLGWNMLKRWKILVTIYYAQLLAFYVALLFVFVQVRMEM